MSDWSDFLAFLGFMGCSIFAVVGGIGLALVFWAAVPGPLGCRDFGEAMKVKTEYRFWYGCFVTMSNGEILPLELASDVLKQRYTVEIKKP